MRFEDMRKELKSFYWNDNGERSAKFAEKCFASLDSKVTNEMSVMEQKLLQYKVIVDEFEPKIFKNSPFYYETAVLSSMSDGSRYAKETGNLQAGGWVYNRNAHLFAEQDPKLWDKRCKQVGEQLYLICGAYNDTSQHFNFNNRPILKKGLKGIYEEAKNALTEAETKEQKEFLHGVCQSMLEIKRAAEKFSKKAYKMLVDDADNENLKIIAQTSARVPWEAPKTFYEALNTLAFMRKMVGSLEGVGPNTFGRIDMDLYSFYEEDIKSGKNTKSEAFDLIRQFLITWDMHYDHNIKMIMYADHELENTYVLGGCDLEGKPLYNELTRMFLQANREEKTIYPKIKCRFSKNSPKDYLDEINKSVIKGTSTIIYQNDDATIPALLQAGKTIEEARDYLVSGCWDIATYQDKTDCGNYLNLLKPFEYALHKLYNKMEKVGLKFKTFDDCKTFEELYQSVLYNCEVLIKERISITNQGGRIFQKVDPLPIFSSTLDDCLKNKADYRDGGSRYRDDYYLFFGLPDIVDSLLVIKTLVFDTQKYTLNEMLDAVRSNWENREDMRVEATKCHGWGDGETDSCELANRFNNDLFKIADRLDGGYSGKVRFEHLTYTEIRWWGENTLATPNGRKNGEYFAQGLTPSRLKKIPHVNDVINSLAALDASVMINNVVNIILPVGKTTLDYLEKFLRVAASTAMQSLQLNCTSKEQLLDAQKHPEKYPDLIVRVTGFSAKFTSLSPEWQQEVITRNFYE